MTYSHPLNSVLEDESIQLEQHGSILKIWLNRPDSRNAMSLNMVKSIMSVFKAIENDTSVRAVVFRGHGHHFCAGGDIKDMASIRAEAASLGSNKPYIDFNRTFGSMLELVEQAPQTVVAVLEGAVLGGGFGPLAEALPLTLQPELAFRRDRSRQGIVALFIQPGGDGGDHRPGARLRRMAEFAQHTQHVLVIGVTIDPLRQPQGGAAPRLRPGEAPFQPGDVGGRAAREPGDLRIAALQQPEQLGDPIR